MRLLSWRRCDGGADQEKADHGQLKNNPTRARHS